MGELVKIIELSGYTLNRLISFSNINPIQEIQNSDSVKLHFLWYNFKSCLLFS